MNTYALIMPVSIIKKINRWFILSESLPVMKLPSARQMNSVNINVKIEVIWLPESVMFCVYHKNKKTEEAMLQKAYIRFRTGGLLCLEVFIWNFKEVKTNKKLSSSLCNYFLT
jgi:hypothetical protein